MDIKVGFVASPRDIVISTAESGRGDTGGDSGATGNRDALIARIEEFLAADSGTLSLEDSKGGVVILVREQVAYVEVGAAATRAVGFI